MLKNEDFVLLHYHHPTLFLTIEFLCKVNRKCFHFYGHVDDCSPLNQIVYLDYFLSHKFFLKFYPFLLFYQFLFACGCFFFLKCTKRYDKYLYIYMWQITFKCLNMSNYQYHLLSQRPSFSAFFRPAQI